MYKKYRAFIKSSKTLNLYYKIVLVWCYTALLAPLIANDRPLFCNYENNWLFPAFSLKNQHIINAENKPIVINYNMGNDWKKLPCSTIVFPLCSYSPKTIDAINAPFISPFDNQHQENNFSLPWKYRHWLGTTQNGNDVLSGIIHGSRIAILVGLLSIIIASIIGISLGSIAGYFEDKKIKIGILESVFILIALLFIYFYNFIVFADSFKETLIEGRVSFFIYLFMSLILSIIGIILFLLIGKKLDKAIGITPKINLPIDLFISKKIEILYSIPTLLILIAISSIAQPSYGLLIVLLSFFSWPNIARLTRAEFLKEKKSDYVISAKALGLKHFSIMYKHILPNVIPVILVQIIFGIAGCIIIESSLSFIGIGIPGNSVSWGTLLNDARNNISAWWLVLFPGLSLFILVYSFNKIAQKLNQLIHRK